MIDSKSFTEYCKQKVLKEATKGLYTIKFIILTIDSIKLYFLLEFQREATSDWIQKSSSDLENLNKIQNKL